MVYLEPEARLDQQTPENRQMRHAGWLAVPGCKPVSDDQQEQIQAIVSPAPFFIPECDS